MAQMAGRRSRTKSEEIAKQYIRQKRDQDGFEVRLLEEKGRAIDIKIFVARKMPCAPTLCCIPPFGYMINSLQVTSVLS